MIVPMKKYTLLVYHKDYSHFLDRLQKLGVVHIAEKGLEPSGKIRDKYARINQYDQVIQFLEKRSKNPEKMDAEQNGEEILDSILEKQEQLEKFQIRLEDINKDLVRALPWGTFSHDRLAILRSNNISLSFYTSTAKQFKEVEETGHPVFLISEVGNLVYFMLVLTRGEEFIPDAEEVQLPPVPYYALLQEKEKTELEILDVEACFDSYAQNGISYLLHSKSKLQETLEVDEAHLNTGNEADHKLKVLEGWVPDSVRISLDEYLKQNDVLHISSKPTPSDKIPVLLKNNRFSKLFEPIGSMFSLPDYAELDLTVFFAPFFMLFFGFCLGDAGYGLLFLVGGGLYKLKAKKAVRPYLTLIQLLGLATILFGAISGTFFGINLIEVNFSITEEFRHLFFDPNKMFNLALILGGIQIVFGLFIRAANQTKQFGFAYSLATYGWLIIILGSLLYVIGTDTGLIPKNKTILYAIMGAGGFFILFFSDPSVNVFARVGKGVWDTYSTVTGIFGDLLSYIRLFALGLSSSILGFVINDIGLQILGASKILGPVFFAIFLLLGHTLNILISSLGSFVHPMRLTFVEFYKSAGFKGGGEEYKPFGRVNSEQ